MRRLRLIGLCLLYGCPDAPLSAATQAEAAGQTDRAAELYLAQAKRDPANLKAWDGAVRIRCTQQARIGACLSVLDLELKLLGAVDRHAQALSATLEQRAQQRLEAGLLDPALSDLDRAQRISPQRAAPWVLRARVYMARGQRAEALKAILQARSLDPNNPDATALMAQLPSEAPFGGPSTPSPTPSARPTAPTPPP